MGTHGMMRIWPAERLCVRASASVLHKTHRAPIALTVLHSVRMSCGVLMLRAPQKTQSSHNHAHDSTQNTQLAHIAHAIARDTQHNTTQSTAFSHFARAASLHYARSCLRLCDRRDNSGRKSPCHCGAVQKRCAGPRLLEKAYCGRKITIYATNTLNKIGVH